MQTYKTQVHVDGLFCRSCCCCWWWWWQLSMIDNDDDEFKTTDFLTVKPSGFSTKNENKVHKIVEYTKLQIKTNWQNKIAFVCKNIPCISIIDKIKLR